MAKNKTKKQLDQVSQEIDDTEKKLEAFEQSLTKTEMYIEENKNSLMIIVLAIIVLFGGYYAYQGFYVKPQAEKAQNHMFTAENYFKKGDFETALNGDGQDIGFIEMTEDFGGTPAGNLANAYAGICLAKTGKFDEAISYLEAYDNSSSVVAPMVKSALANAYLQTNDTDKGLSLLIESANETENKFAKSSILMRAANVARGLDNKDQAIKLYNEVVSLDKNSRDAMEAQKMLAQLGEF
jgi:tetratricopeptide (TPR) repeat protein